MSDDQRSTHNSDDAEQTWIVNADHDIRVASWRIADLLIGQDDGSAARDDIECQIQEVMVQSFTETSGKIPTFTEPSWESMLRGYGLHRARETEKATVHPVVKQLVQAQLKRRKRLK